MKIEPNGNTPPKTVITAGSINLIVDWIRQNQFILM